MKLFDTIKGIAKLILQSRHAPVRKQAGGADEAIVVMGNGPSLRQTVAERGDLIRHHPLLAVNYAANTPDFLELKPSYYVIADPHFFENASTDPNVRHLIDNLFGVTAWPMTLFIPAGAKFEAPKANPNVRVERFNCIGIEGFRSFRNAVYDARRGMPRPRNVLIPSLMIALWLGYRKVYVAGADHSWTRTLEVNDRNEVVSVQPHFYEEDAKEVERVTAVYRNVRLHEILYSFYVAFKSYFDIADYARKIGAQIINITPGSFIDAFDREK